VKLFHCTAGALALFLIAFDCAAADPPDGARATPGSVVPSTGTTASAPPLAPTRAASAVRPKTAGSLSPPPPPDCAALRARYAQSQACFAPYRLANGGIKPEAYKRCREMPDPALTCGPATAAPQ
jgi:hypothetical protein